jgi:hypothetical protein
MVSFSQFFMPLGSAATPRSGGSWSLVEVDGAGKARPPRSCATPRDFVETLFAGVHGLALSAVDQLRALWPDAPNGNATQATRTTMFGLQTDKKTALAVRLLRSFYCFFKNALVTVLRYACEAEARTRGEWVKPYIELLTEATCDPFFWTFLKAADPGGTRNWSLRTQLDQLSNPDNLIAALRQELDLTDVKDAKRRERLECCIKIVRKGGLNPQLQHWVGDAVDANRAGGGNSRRRPPTRHAPRCSPRTGAQHRPLVQFQ